MKIYIAGPIAGKSRPELISSFGIAADDLRALGHKVVDPTDMSPWGLSWGTYMRITREILISGDIDAVYMLKGWEGSRGATTEYRWARGLGLPIYEEADGWIEHQKRKVKDPGDAWYRENFVEKCDDGKGMLKPAPLLRKVAEIIEEGEL